MTTQQDPEPKTPKSGVKRTNRGKLSPKNELAAPADDAEIRREIKETSGPRPSRIEVASRLKIAEEDAEHERLKERWILKALLFAASGVFVISAAVLIASTFSNKPNLLSLQSWASGALMAVLSGFFAYFTARQKK